MMEFVKPQQIVFFSANQQFWERAREAQPRCAQPGAAELGPAVGSWNREKPAYLSQSGLMEVVYCWLITNWEEGSTNQPDSWCWQTYKDLTVIFGLSSSRNTNPLTWALSDTTCLLGLLLGKVTNCWPNSVRVPPNSLGRTMVESEPTVPILVLHIEGARKRTWVWRLN